MTTVKPLLVSFSLLALLGASAYADDGSRDNKDKNAQKAPASAPQKPGGASAGGSKDAKMNRTLSRASELIGKDVTNPQGEDLGEIKDLVIDLQSGKVHSAVLEFGGFLGMGEKQYAFPVSELKPAKDHDKLLLNVDKDKLKSAQGFEENEWPAMNDEYWTRVGGKASAQGGAHLIRASELMGKNIQDKSGKDAGEIEDAMVDLNTGRITNVSIDVDGGGQAMVPAKALSAGTGDKLVVNMSADQLKRQSKSAQGASGDGKQKGGAMTR